VNYVVNEIKIYSLCEKQNIKYIKYRLIFLICKIINIVFVLYKLQIQHTKIKQYTFKIKIHLKLISTIRKNIKNISKLLT
jgi:hypothetical protein